MNEQDIKLEYLYQKAQFEKAKKKGEVVGDYMTFQQYIQACGYFYVEDEES